MDVEKVLNKLLKKVSEIETEIKGLKNIDTHQMGKENTIINYLEKALKNHDRNKKLDVIILLMSITIVMAAYMIFSLYMLAE